MKEKRVFNGGQIIAAFIGGAAAGAIAAMLTAPRSGSETRRYLLDSARSTSSRAKRIPSAVRQAYSSAADAARNAFYEAYHPEAPEAGR